MLGMAACTIFSGVGHSAERGVQPMVRVNSGCYFSVTFETFETGAAGSYFMTFRALGWAADRFVGIRQRSGRDLRVPCGNQH
jgi:hypothetical protein